MPYKNDTKIRFIYLKEEITERKPTTLKNCPRFELVKMVCVAWILITVKEQ
jgi:hypothetical protein